MDEPSSNQSAAPTAPQQGGVRWISAAAEASYCNVAAAAPAADGVALSFGVSQARSPGSAEVGVELLHRIVLAPLAAKNLHRLLTRVIDEHDARRPAR